MCIIVIFPSVYVHLVLVIHFICLTSFVVTVFASIRTCPWWSGVVSVVMVVVLCVCVCVCVCDGVLSASLVSCWSKKIQSQKV